ncbi:ferritin-like domain-containing protein [Nocardioides sp. Y6]|uniref:Ferritin-like domain-containing protein n=1 Tax=Nocardioides malaquae TaxID=2773426 RepID=A0ABR9RP40_9ACTN|nr:ferritin-like domain-containing protein [Nocardioides malaquae]MBE7323337.1 ferritin-like domain-containing protein [Nocardioides malaquae]
MTTDAPTLESSVPALQEALAAEHAAVHLLGHLGGVVSARTDPAQHLLLRAGHVRHRTLRDRLVEALRSVGATPTPAEAAYSLPTGSDATSVRTAVVDLEERCAQTYALLVASTTGELRATAMEALVAAGRAQVAWGAPPTPFPGAPELLDASRS